MAMSTISKTLVAFDFDYTVVDGDYDKFLAKLLPVGVPEELKAIYEEEKQWSEYMTGLFNVLHKNGVKPADIKETVVQSTLVVGMRELFGCLEGERYDIIVISDANALFIDWLLTEHGLRQHVKEIYANPAEFNAEGRLEMTYYHQQHCCDLSTKNLCKGKALNDHIQREKENGIIYSRAMFVGDGDNDYCPTLELSADDYVFPRLDFALERRIREDKSNVKAKVVPWRSGRDIVQVLQSIS